MRTAGEETKPERMSSAFLSGAVAQFGRAPRSQCGGQGFDPPLLHQKSPVFNNYEVAFKVMESR